VLAQRTGLAISRRGQLLVPSERSEELSIDDGRTRTIIHSPPILAVAARRGVARILVRQGSAFIASTRGKNKGRIGGCFP